MADLRALKGMNDVLPEEAGRWRALEETFRSWMVRYHYREIRTPLLESTKLFVRAVGETTDIVEKEMYSFVHRSEEMTLRPEGTAGAARAFVEHKVFASAPVTKWFYVGPMFRAERPQRGRLRQFWQLGCEVYGDPGPACDAEMIDMLASFLLEWGVTDLDVLVNSVGGAESRAAYRERLVEYFSKFKSDLSEDSQKRLERNPLRILDSKNEKDQSLVADAPFLRDSLTEADRAHFDSVCAFLTDLGTPYRIDPRLVRGLDYYNRTTFEMKGATAELGAGSTLLGGGRYDTMLEELGAPSTPAIGFGAGMERLLIASSSRDASKPLCALFFPLGAKAAARAMVLAKEARAHGVSVEVDAREGSLKTKLRRADSLGATYAIVIGDDELAKGVGQLKTLKTHEQAECSFEAILATLKGTAAERSAS